MPQGTVHSALSEYFFFVHIFFMRHCFRSNAYRKVFPQMNPTGGAGALTAMHDAVTLANWICTLEAPSPSEIEDIFKEYRAERYPVAKEAFETSQVFTKTLGKVCGDTRNCSVLRSARSLTQYMLFAIFLLSEYAFRDRSGCNETTPCLAVEAPDDSHVPNAPSSFLSSSD